MYINFIKENSHVLKRPFHERTVKIVLIRTMIVVKKTSFSKKGSVKFRLDFIYTYILFNKPKERTPANLER